MSLSLQLPHISKKVEEISQSHFGDHSLDAISGAGKTTNPKIALVFINPTHRNISTRKSWNGLKAPWIGCANIWQLLADAGLIDEDMNQTIQRAKSDWSQDFAVDVYSHVENRSLYITNIVKWAGLDAKLPEKEKIKLYTPLLIDELKMLNADYIVAFGQLTFDALMRAMDILITHSFGSLNESMIIERKIAVIDSAVGKIVPCYFPVGQGIKNKAKAVKILRLVATIADLSVDVSLQV